MFFEDVEEGKVYKAEVKKPITGTEIDMTCQLSGMDQRGFVDPEYAKGMGFRDRVLPGAYAMACLFGIMGKHGFLSDAIWVHATDIFFRAPIFPGDVLSAECEAIGKKESKRGGGQVTYRWRLKNQEDKIAVEGTNT